MRMLNEYKHVPPVITNARTIHTSAPTKTSHMTHPFAVLKRTISLCLCLVREWLCDFCGTCRGFHERRPLIAALH